MELWSVCECGRLCECVIALYMCECVSVTELDSLGSRAPMQTVLLFFAPRPGHEMYHMTRADRQTNSSSQYHKCTHRASPGKGPLSANGDPL